MAEPASEGLPPWLFAWWLRLAGALADFTLRRLQARAVRAQSERPRKNVTPEATTATDAPPAQ